MIVEISAYAPSGGNVPSAATLCKTTASQDS